MPIRVDPGDASEAMSRHSSNENRPGIQHDLVRPAANGKSRILLNEMKIFHEGAL